MFGNEGVVAPRFSSQLRTETHHQCQNVCPLLVTSSAQVSGEKALLLCKQSDTRAAKNLQRIENAFQLDRIIAILVPCLPSHPSPYCCSPYLMGEKRQNTATVGQTLTQVKTTLRPRDLETQLLASE